jgi:predicted metalloprotease with PDZ domain
MGAAGRIGLGYLQRYRVLLDPSAGRMVMAAGSDVDRPPLRSTSGLLVGFYSDRLRVLHVMRGSPAAVAGWQAGDQICSVDGQPITANYASEPISTWSVADPGRIVRLGICGGGVRKLTLERFY